MNEVTLTREQAGIGVFASDDSNRKVLNTVQLENGRLAATDGRMLGTIPVGSNGASMLISAVELLKLARKTKKSAPNVHLAVDNAGELRGMVNGSVKVLETVEGRFPNVDRVTPDATDYTVSVVLGLPILQKLVKYMENAGRDPARNGAAPSLKLRFSQSEMANLAELGNGGQALQPVIWESGEAVGVLMPMRSA